MKTIATCSAAALVLAAMALTGCVSGSARDGARLLSAYTTKLADDGEQFAKFRLELARARQGLIQRLEENAVTNEQANERAAGLWKMADDSVRGNLYANIRQATGQTEAQQQALDELRRGHEKAIAGSVTAVNIRTDKLAATAKALGQLAKPPAWDDEVKFYFGFVKEVSDSLAAARDQAKESTKSGTTETTKKADTITKAEEIIRTDLTTRKP